MGQAISKECCTTKGCCRRGESEENTAPKKDKKSKPQKEKPMQKSKSKRYRANEEEDMVFQTSTTHKNIEKTEGQKEEYSTEGKDFYSPNYFKVTTESSAKPTKDKNGNEIFQCKYKTGEEKVEETESWNTDPMMFQYNDHFDKMLGDFHNDRYNQRVRYVSTNSNVRILF